MVYGMQVNEYLMHKYLMIISSETAAAYPYYSIIYLYTMTKYDNFITIHYGDIILAYLVYIHIFHSRSHPP